MNNLQTSEVPSFYSSSKGRRMDTNVQQFPYEHKRVAISAGAIFLNVVMAISAGARILKVVMAISAGARGLKVVMEI